MAITSAEAEVPHAAFTGPGSLPAKLEGDGIMAQRLDSAIGHSSILSASKADEPRSVVERTVETIEGLLGASGANLLYAGYPYDPFATDAPKS
jgi:hypothetical protein